MEMDEILDYDIELKFQEGENIGLLDQCQLDIDKDSLIIRVNIGLY